MTDPAGRGPVSWAKSDLPRTGPPRLARRLERGSWVDLLLGLAFTACWDLIALLVGGDANHWVHCGLECRPEQQVAVDHTQLWLVPLLLAVPVLVALLARRARVLVAVAQLAVFVLLLVATLHRLRQEQPRPIVAGQPAVGASRSPAVSPGSAPGEAGSAPTSTSRLA